VLCLTVYIIPSLTLISTFAKTKVSTRQHRAHCCSAQYECSCWHKKNFQVFEVRILLWSLFSRVLLLKFQRVLYFNTNFKKTSRKERNEKYTDAGRQGDSNLSVERASVCVCVRWATAMRTYRALYAACTTNTAASAPRGLRWNIRPTCFTALLNP